MVLLVLRNLLLTIPGVLLVTVVAGTASLAVSLVSRTGRTQHRIARAWARWLLRVAGVRVEVEGIERVPPGGTFVFVANHRSYLDAPIVLASIEMQFRFFAKRSVFWWPIIGYHLKRSGHMPVHYTNPRESLKSMSAAARVIQQTGYSILLFPEAERTKGGLQEFKDGAAYVAIKAGAAVVPVGIQGAERVLGVGAMLIRPGRVRLRIGDPIPTLDLSMADRSRLTQTLMARVAELTGEPASEQEAVSVRN